MGRRERTMRKEVVVVQRAWNLDALDPKPLATNLGKPDLTPRARNLGATVDAMAGGCVEAAQDKCGAEGAVQDEYGAREVVRDLAQEGQHKIRHGGQHRRSGGKGN
ncbi:hypothetical protein GUJ93_ZPchr0061g33652 [Zizania palustris]|uniref:Uncharacterized protein n=1 Tax=Zizania palustris TaxID=103762 RepID=A0A8J5R2E4_ZIZPA|nr:hypothetical protein GUJ93_ZPchr0061g33652 [Zizania palustris]